MIRNVLDKKRSNETSDGDQQTISKSEVKEAVREGVTEALDERESDTESTDTEVVSDGTSGGRRSMKGALVIGIVAALSYLIRRRRRSSQSEETE